MSDDRPLDSLIPGLRVPRSNGGLHLMEASIAGAPAWVFGLDRDPGGAAGLQRWAAHHLEAALVARAAEPAPAVRGDHPEGYGVPPTGGLHLFLYASIAGNLSAALRPFGLVQSALSGPRWDEVRKGFGEAIAAPVPVATFSAKVQMKPELARIHAALVADTGEPWGTEPGRPAARLLHLAADLLGTPLRADRAGLDAVEELVVDDAPEVLRWLPPLVLQALADLVGLVVEQDLQAPVEWAECAPEPDGYTPPPLFRLRTRRAEEPVHLPIAQHLVRWCVMPLRRGEVTVPLSAWLTDEIGP